MDNQKTTNKIQFRIILLTGLVSLVVGVGSGLLINYFTEKRAKLTYDITTQEVFSGQLNNIGIFAMRIANDGKREIEQILCQLVFPEGKITERRIVGIPESARSVKEVDNEVEVNVPFLNPGEQFSIQILLSGVIKPLVRPTIEVRGKGILGKQAESEKSSRGGEVFSIITAVFAALGTAVTFAIYSRRKIAPFYLKYLKPVEIETIEESHHSGDQRDILAYALELKSLSEDAQYIRNLPRKITYWSLSDALCNRWLISADKDRIRSGIEALDLLIDYAAIHDQSKRIIMVNMARLALALEDIEKARGYLKIAKERQDTIINKRIKADPTLKTISVETGT
jgi:hypothetical protein